MFDRLLVNANGNGETSTRTEIRRIKETNDTRMRVRKLIESVQESGGNTKSSMCTEDDMNEDQRKVQRKMRFERLKETMALCQNWKRRVDLKVRRMTVPLFSVHTTRNAVNGKMRELLEVDVNGTDFTSFDDMIDKIATEEGKALIRALIATHPKAFYTGGKLPYTSVLEHEIPLFDENAVVNVQGRPLSWKETQVAEVKIVELISKGVIVASSGSQFNTPIAVIPKSTPGAFRFIQTFVKLNANTKNKSLFPMKRIDEILASLEGKSYLSSADLQDGFYQVRIKEGDRRKTAFTCAGNQYENDRMCQGLTGSPATFNRLMSLVLSGIKHLCIDGEEVSLCERFVDDIINASSELHGHVYHWDLILRALERANLVLSPKKFLALQESIKFCGKLNDEHGIRPKPDDIQRLCEWPKPTTNKEMRQWLGLLNYVTEHIDDEKLVGVPIREMMKACPRTLRWSEEADKAFIEIRWRLKHSLRLAFPIFDDESCKFILATDASKNGVSAVLSQIQRDGTRKVVSFASQAMDERERRLGMPQKEAMALVYGLLRFERWIKGQALDIECDHSALVDCFTRGATKDAMLARMLLVVQSIGPENFLHVNGVDIIADLFSRNPLFSRESQEFHKYEREFFDRDEVRSMSTRTGNKETIGKWARTNHRGKDAAAKTRFASVVDACNAMDPEARIGVPQPVQEQEVTAVGVMNVTSDKVAGDGAITLERGSVVSNGDVVASKIVTGCDAMIGEEIMRSDGAMTFKIGTGMSPGDVEKTAVCGHLEKKGGRAVLQASEVVQHGATAVEAKGEHLEKQDANRGSVGKQINAVFSAAQAHKASGSEMLRDTGVRRQQNDIGVALGDGVEVSSTHRVGSKQTRFRVAPIGDFNCRTRSQPILLVCVVKRK